MERLEVGISPHQCCRLRNGHPVRVKPVMKGSGVILMVAPSTYNSATRSLAKQKGVQIRLNAEEIQANREGAGEMEGRGIFKAVEKIAKKATPVVKKVAIAGAKQVGREVAKKLPQLATAGLTAAALATGQPQLIPLAGIAGDKLGTFAGKELNKAIDKPSKYSSFKKAREEIGKSALQEVKDEATSFGKAKIGEAKQYGKERLKKELAGNGLGSSKISDDFTELRKQIDKLKIKLAKMEDLRTGSRTLLADRIKLQKKIEQMEQKYNEIMREKRGIAGIGLYAGRGMGGEGLYAGRQGRGVANTPTAGLVGVNGSLLAMSHPAFQSQAHSANFQFQHTLPPQFQMRGNMNGSGLYA